jgi:hypothetical protein
MYALTKCLLVHALLSLLYPNPGLTPIYPLKE